MGVWEKMWIYWYHYAVCLRRLETNNEIEHFAALQVLYVCVAQCQEICNILFLSTGSNVFGKKVKLILL